jgi:transcription initiation factor IIE alpha subunit
MKQINKDKENINTLLQLIRENHEPTDYIVLAMQALGKQVPQKPSIEDEMGYFMCPNCNAAINYTSDREDHKFCLNCGQKLDWN